MSDNPLISSLSNAKRGEVSSCDVNATIFPTSEIGRSDQVVTPTSLEKENSSSSTSSMKNALSKTIDETPLKRIKKRNNKKPHEKTHEETHEETNEESPAANSMERSKNDEIDTLSGISKYLKSKNILIEKESIKGYKELEDVKISAQAQIDKLKSLNTFQQLDNFDWSKIEEAYSFIFNDYINEMELTIRDLDQSMKERRAWQEIIFTLDRERSAERINKSERWITAKEINFNDVKQDLANSVKLIQKEFLKFETPKKRKTHSPFDVNN